MTKQGNLFEGLPVYVGRLGDHPLYRAWSAMKARCFNPKHAAFHNYGGRGISVCDEWRGSSAAFIAWAVKAGWKPGLDLDRVNNDGPYSPDNCRFVTRRQNTNNRRVTARLSDGTALADAARLAGVSLVTVHCRIKKGWLPDDAVSVPVRPKRPRLDVSASSGDDANTPAMARVGDVMPRNLSAACETRAAFAHHKGNRHG